MWIALIIIVLIFLIISMYNTKLEVFSSNFIASTFGFKEEDFSKIESEEFRGSVKIDFGK